MKIGNQLHIQPNLNIQNNADTGVLKGLVITVGKGLSKMGNAISNFFKNSLPNFFKSLADRLPSIGSPPQSRLHSLIDFRDFLDQPVSNDDDGYDSPLDLSEFPTHTPELSEHERAQLEHQQLMNETKGDYEKYNKTNMMADAQDYLHDPIDEEIVLRDIPKKSGEIKDVAGKQSLRDSQISNSDINDLMEELTGETSDEFQHTMGRESLEDSQISGHDIDKLFEELTGSKTLPSSSLVSSGGKKDVSMDLEKLLHELAEEVTDSNEGTQSFSPVSDQRKQIMQLAGKEPPTSKDLENLINEAAEEVKETEGGGELYQTLNQDMKNMVEKPTQDTIQDITQSKQLPKDIGQNIINLLGGSKMEQN